MSSGSDVCPRSIRFTWSQDDPCACLLQAFGALSRLRTGKVEDFLAEMRGVCSLMQACVDPPKVHRSHGLRVSYLLLPLVFLVTVYRGEIEKQRFAHCMSSFCVCMCFRV